MIGLSAHIINTGNLLTIHIPANAIMLFGWLVGVIFVIGLRLILLSAKAGVGKQFGFFPILITGCLIFILSALYNPCSIVLDADKHTATIDMMMFFIPRHQSFDLSQIQGAMVATADGTDALRIVFMGGRSFQLTAYQATGGTDEAANAINEFLREPGGVGSPY